MDLRYPDDSNEPLIENSRNKRKCSVPTDKSRKRLQKASESRKSSFPLSKEVEAADINNRPSTDLTRSS